MSENGTPATEAAETTQTRNYGEIRVAEYSALDGEPETLRLVGTPRFTSTREAESWLKDHAEGRHAVLQLKRIVDVEVKTVRTATLTVVDL